MTVTPDVYKTCPIYETENLILRLVQQEDAKDLLDCYSDKDAISLMNSDECTNNFYYSNVMEMLSAIDFWLSEYKKGLYVRFSIIEKANNKAIGTVEFFDEEFPHIGRAGLMRLDLASAYEMTSVITEIISLAQGYFPTDFDVQKILVKIKNSPKRKTVFTALGFQPTDDFRPGLGYYVYHVRDISYCGLACALCSENENCVGCQNGGCEAHGWCKNYLCCREKGIGSCSECAEFSCDKGMLTKMRIRAFSRFAQVYGKKELIRCLHRNKATGIVYHYEGQLVGDYDKCQTEEEIIEMIKTGNKLFGLPCYCGHDCSKCVTYIATQTNNDDLRRQAQSFYKERFGLDIPLDKFYCDGGRSKNVFELCKECPFKKCCIEHGIDACGKCSEYPCKDISDYQEKYVNKCNQLEKNNDYRRNKNSSVSKPTLAPIDK